ncbi:bifunctional diaminohydroxyphosphoribosylaminopyrimidine deaminase/5-amino-6-(5-phosphoribosylamino)uracil reductase RibD [Flavobacterium restrictum]|uniref:Riboflavin biosynthesis protein RibD n=1 Tax=Flavobacterium restrictum TaxID=2594428 RepID=A0A553DU12_9FLAO|nr:bifunctional diaminohydroxyphosphoribosylaminopyrimidine deaminase/5-amino-6-(5-phosphoribosylamino)uracil reductase RibD [Flavobacterium restrictum]TRX36266.1 bifunctional diaminohydroxyphosphoribosylaminopyrimidine deaminase/5-amino-6-(5-phosphoribosylamino)uracil reductase RibD [Flavobacterium restrictum]
MNSPEKYMKRCLELARNGLPASMPNPSVGAVIVVDDCIIGEGYTAPYGGSHAEVNAINAVKDKTLLEKATLYVSLEPCSHFGKTPPCCDLIIQYKIPNVVVGILDTNIKVAGKGIQKLRESGTRVTVGVLEADCYESNKRFFTFHEKKRPYIILKWAQSQDGFIAPLVKDEIKPVWITNPISRQLVHKWRSEEQAILVGTQTAIDDNPKLNTRDWSGKNPIRLVLDQHNRIPKSSHIFDNQTQTIIFTKQEILFNQENTIFETIDFEQNTVPQILEVLYQYQIQSVLIEGGTQLLNTFLAANIWDEARVFIGKKEFKTGIKAPEVPKGNTQKHTILDDELQIISNHD